MRNQRLDGGGKLVAATVRHGTIGDHQVGVYPFELELGTSVRFHRNSMRDPAEEMQSKVKVSHSKTELRAIERKIGNLGNAFAEDYSLMVFRQLRDAECECERLLKTITNRDNARTLPTIASLIQRQKLLTCQLQKRPRETIEMLVDCFNADRNTGQIQLRTAPACGAGTRKEW